MRRIKLLTVGLAVFLFSCQDHSSEPDTEFDVSVQEPGLTRQRILFDQGHKNHHEIGRTYKPLAKLLTNDGCKVESTDEHIDATTLSSADIYVIATAANKEEPGDKSAFTDEEIATLEEWVKNGGSALILTEHYPYGISMESLFRKFGVKVHNGYTEDTVLNNKEVSGALLFEKSEGNLNSHHPITANINKVNTFTGSSVKADSTWTDLLILSDHAQNYNVDVKVIKEGGDVNVNVSYADFYSANGFSQGICKVYGKGKIVILAESALITAQLDRNENKFGMNVPGYDNKEFTLNIFRWLAENP